MKERRYKILAVMPEFLVELFAGKPISLESGALPPDAKMVGLGRTKEYWRFDPDYCQILIIVESAEFDIVPEGQAIPYAEPATFKYA